MAKMLIAGFNLQTGTSSKTGNAYSMPRVVTLEPFEGFESSTLRRSGCGYVSGELPCTPEVVAAGVGLKYPAFYEVTIETHLRAGQYEPIVTALIKPQQ